MGTRRWLFLLLVSLFAGLAVAGVVSRERQERAVGTRLAAGQAGGLEADARPTQDGQVVATVSEAEARRIAARFLDATADVLQTQHFPPPRPGRTGPPFWRFVLPLAETAQVGDWQRELGAASIRVNAVNGQVMDVDYLSAKWQMGPGQLGEEEARRSAEAYLKARWPQWERARFLKGRQAQRPSATEARAPQQSFEWVVEENGIRVGSAFVSVNLTTGDIIGYAQGFYSAAGLPPAKLTKEQALDRARAAVPGLRAPAQEAARLTDAFLMTQWRSGKVVLVWRLEVSTPGGTGGGQGGNRQEGKHLILLDAHTGEVYAATQFHGA